MIRSKKYVGLYLKIANMEDYFGDDMISVILCKYRIKEFSSRFIDLYNMNPDAVSWNMANYGYLNRRMPNGTYGGVRGATC